MNAIHTKELLLTSHLQSPPGHRQDPFNKPSSETPIVQNLQLTTGYHHSLCYEKRQEKSPFDPMLSESVHEEES
uniref:Uncharacterized protein n=1 Tax=Nomascus leucogenys TaxID=61853 RepID=A0A2I3HHA0_NOMLE